MKQIHKSVTSSGNWRKPNSQPNLLNTKRMRLNFFRISNLLVFLLQMVGSKAPAQNLFVDSLRLNGNKQIIVKNELATIKIDTIVTSLEVFLRDSSSYTFQLINAEPLPQKALYPYIRYTHLDGGEYSLKIWNNKQQEQTIAILIKPPFWQEWWFWPLTIAYVILLIGIIIYLFFLYDFRQKLKVQYIRNTIASDLHDEVGSNLNSIAIFVDLLRKNAPKELLPLLDKITANATESVSLMQDTVWAINPKNDSLDLLIERSSTFALNLLTVKGIEVVIDKRLKTNPSVLTMEQRKNTYLILKEAINNIAKHSLATQATLLFIQHNDGLEIVIKDNGIGFDTQLVTSGNGRYNFEQRANEVGIRLELSSTLRQGTTVALFVSA